MALEFNGEFKQPFLWLKNNYEFRFNVVTGLYEFRRLVKGKPSSKYPFIPFEDRNKNDISLEIISNDLQLPDSRLNNYIESVYNSPDYDPFKEYFNELPEYNNKKDYIKELAATIKTENSEYLASTL